LSAPFWQQNLPLPPLKQQSGNDESSAPLVHLDGGGVGTVDAGGWVTGLHGHWHGWHGNHGMLKEQAYNC
jgi:hypothetical protein